MSVELCYSEFVLQAESGLETSTLELRFRITDKHYRRADLKLKCTATIATIYWRSNEESVQIVRKQTEYSQYRSQVSVYSTYYTLTVQRPYF